MTGVFCRHWRIGPGRSVVPAKKYRIQLTQEEQQELRALVSRGRAAAYRQTHARIPRFHEGRLCC